MLYLRSGKPSQLHYLSCEFVKRFIPYLTHANTECLPIETIEYLRGKALPHGTLFGPEDIGDLLNIKDPFPKYTKNAEYNIQFLVKLLDVNVSCTPIVEFVLLCQTNSWFMCFMTQVQLTMENWSLDTLLQDITDTEPADFDKTTAGLFKLGFLPQANIYAITGNEIPKPVLNKLVTGKLSHQEDLLDAILLPSKPAQFTLDDFPHVNTELISNYVSGATNKRQAGISLLFYGASGTGKTELARAIAAATGRTLFEVRANSITSGRLNDEFSAKHPNKERLRYLSLIGCLLSTSNNAMLLIDECESLFEDADLHYSKDHLQRYLEDNHIPCIWITNHVDCLEPSFIRRFKLVIEINEPSSDALNSVCKRYYKGLSLSSQFKRSLTRTNNISPAVIANATHIAKTLGYKRTDAENTILQVAHSTLRAANLLNDTTRYQGDIAFNPALLNIKQQSVQLDDVAYALKHNKPARILLMGPPGIGKTAYAHYLAESNKRELIRVKCSDVLSKWVGESEQNIAELFQRAHTEEKIILLDEVDSLLVSRDTLTAHHDVQLVNEFLTQIECFTQPLFAATNFDSRLDKAVLRRFDFKLECDYLTADQVCQLYKQVLLVKKITNDEALQLRQLHHLTPGDFAILARRQLFHPALNHRLTAITLLAEENQRKQPKAQMGFIRPH